MRISARFTGCVAAGLTAALAFLTAGCGALGSEDDTLTIKIGRQPYAAGNSPITQHMMENELVEKAANDLGVDVDITYLDYPSAAPQVEAMISNRLDFGMWGNTPIIRAMALRQPISVVSAAEGNLRFVLLTEKASGIRNAADLEGKKVGLLVGGDPHLAFIGMLKEELGVSDPAKAGIDLVNLPTQAIAATVPKGVDATVVGYPSVLKQQESDNSVVGVLNSHGVTEPGYSGKVGEGADIELPSAKDSAFAPEGFYGHRSFWVARDRVINDHPEVVQAFLTAEQQAIEALTADDPKDVAGSVDRYWDLTPSNGARVLEDEIVFDRGWPWATEGDAQLLMKLSRLMAQNGVIDEPLEWGDVVDGFRPSSEIAKRAHTAAGGKPRPAAFESTPTDARGTPQWQLDTWTSPQ